MLNNHHPPLPLQERIELLVKRRKATASSLDDFGKSFVKVSFQLRPAPLAVATAVPPICAWPVQVGGIEKSYGDGPLSKVPAELVPNT